MRPAPEPLVARCLGAVLAVAATDPPAAVAVSPVVGTVAVVAVAAVAWYLAPMADVRPTAAARWWPPARHHRPTVLAAGSVALAAATDPPAWLGACVAALLLAYLLATDAWTAGVTAPPGPRPLGPPLIAAAAATLTFLAAQVPLAHTSWSALLAVPALAATTACLLLALLRRGRAG